MNKLIIITALGSLALAACESRQTANWPSDSRARVAPASQTNTMSPTGQTYSTAAAGNSMPGTRGGFNNDEINGKSRNPYSTTPGTGPMHSNPMASGNIPR